MYVHYLLVKKEAKQRSEITSVQNNPPNNSVRSYISISNSNATDNKKLINCLYSHYHINVLK